MKQFVVYYISYFGTLCHEMILARDEDDVRNVFSGREVVSVSLVESPNK